MTQPEFSIEELAQFFELPLKTAALHLHISVSKLKTVCRQLQIPRWPFRKVLLIKFLTVFLRFQA